MRSIMLQEKAEKSGSNSLHVAEQRIAPLHAMNCYSMPLRWAFELHPIMPYQEVQQLRQLPV